MAHTVSSGKSTVTTPANVDEGQDLGISIDLRNQCGNALTATDKELNSVKVELMTGDNDVTICPLVKATDTETSPSLVFAVFNTAGRKGQVKVSVTTDAGHVQGSPAVTTVANVLRFDPDMCHAGLVLSNNGRTVAHYGRQSDCKAVFSFFFFLQNPHISRHWGEWWSVVVGPIKLRRPEVSAS